jgi:hypothetical protein
MHQLSFRPALTPDPHRKATGRTTL